MIGLYRYERWHDVSSITNNIMIMHTNKKSNRFVQSAKCSMECEFSCNIKMIDYFKWKKWILHARCQIYISCVLEIATRKCYKKVKVFFLDWKVTNDNVISEVK